MNSIEQFIESFDWRSLETESTNAHDIPLLLRRLDAPDENLRRQTFRDLDETLTSGFVVSETGLVVLPLLIDFLDLYRYSDLWRIIDLISGLGVGIKNDFILSSKSASAYYESRPETSNATAFKIVESKIDRLAQLLDHSNNLTKNAIADLLSFFTQCSSNFLPRMYDVISTANDDGESLQVANFQLSIGWLEFQIQQKAKLIEIASNNLCLENWYLRMSAAIYLSWHQLDARVIETLRVLKEEALFCAGLFPNVFFCSGELNAYAEVFLGKRHGRQS